MAAAPREHPVPVATSRRLGPLLSAAALLAACGGPAPTPPPPPPTSTAAACPESGIAITAGEVDSASGLRALGILLTNCGTRDYTANGYPVVRVLDENREPLDITVGNGSAPVSAPDAYDVPPRPVTLRPGQRVTARVLWRNTVTDSTVTATEGHYLEVTPAPGEPAQLVAPNGGIDLGNTGRLAVNAWAARP
ncbi:DUF4232 domain-containing protein [Actinokineospora sp. PR83]|uniref:DUF4232 domain-containing protein n=1 Tax=Actinokineospora sp. PR83 TaxID=2884908 RepID=UPI001F2AB724|nr:DUF4232 domain-containing protein [Actinokineospora sp. PR83]MCG8916517.1 DUF4232 domain-containing protein [Actinokineospora sp. PR83]